VAGEIRTYIIAVCRHVPGSWKRGSFIIEMIVSIAVIILLLLGWRFDAISKVVTVCGISLIVILDILVYFPFQLWKANTDKIKLLEDKIARRLIFVRSVREDGGDGHYFGNITVRNISDAKKMIRCRCEIAELRHMSGDLVERNIGLIAKGQQDERFELDQNSEKEIPVFEVDQVEHCVYALGSAGKIRLHYDSYTARIRGYGDTGKADEITLQLDIRVAGFFKLVT
jgi:hypothetical protein